jgi:hypothetical protein
MNMSKKGLKMNISKCLKNYDFEKSNEVTTDIRGQHDFTNGYRFNEVNHENDYIVLFWEDDSLPLDIKAGKMKEIYKILDKHGFTDYIKFFENEGNIILNNYRD